MEVNATHRFARISPQKCRLVAELVRGKPVGEALNILRFSSKKSARVIRKVLESAIANAEHNHGADIDQMKVRRVMVDVAPIFRRFRAGAKGRAKPIAKRNSHVRVIVTND